MCYIFRMYSVYIQDLVKYEMLIYGTKPIITKGSFYQPFAYVLF